MTRWWSARVRTLDELARRNSDWLESHWPDLLPNALGKHLVVAGQEAYIADTAAEAWSLARAAHPEDDGALCQAVAQSRSTHLCTFWQMAGV